MSACALLFDGKKVVMASDTAISSFSNSGDIFRVDGVQEKIFALDNGLIFCSGNLEISNMVIAFIKKERKIDIQKLSIYLKSLNLKDFSKYFSVEIIISIIDSEQKIKIYQLSEYNSFDVKEWNLLDNNILLLTGGFKTKELSEKIEKNFLLSNLVIDILEKSFSDIVCEEVGGYLDIWKMDIKTIEKIKKIKIDNNFYFNSQKSIKNNFCLLVADAIVGNLIAGNTLRISNDNNNFVLDENGAVLTNADFTLNTTSGKTRIFLSPAQGIKVQRKTDGVWYNTLNIDTSGNLVFSGTLSGADGYFSGNIDAFSGTIGGWTISRDGISDTFGNYIRSDGKIKLGALVIDGATAVFDGNIYADKLFGEIVTNQIGDGQVTNVKIDTIRANKITAGTMSADRIFGGTIRWGGSIEDPDVEMGLIGEAWAGIVSKTRISLIADIGDYTSFLGLGDLTAQLGSGLGGEVILGYSGTFGESLRIRTSSVWVSDGSSDRQGKTETFTVSTPSGNKTMIFVRGIYVN